jgi:hypothetical protein
MTTELLIEKYLNESSDLNIIKDIESYIKKESMLRKRLIKDIIKNMKTVNNTSDDIEGFVDSLMTEVTDLLRKNDFDDFDLEYIIQNAVLA